MKFTLDTEKKIITIHSKISLGDFINELIDLFPDGKWKEFRLVQNKNNNYRDIPNYPKVDPSIPEPLPYRPISPYDLQQDDSGQWSYISSGTGTIITLTDDSTNFTTTTDHNDMTYTV